METSHLHIIPPAGDPAEERDLLLRTAQGDERAFRALFDQYKRLLLSFVYRITQDHASAEEIVQDIFVKIWMTREGLTAIQSFKNYLFIVSRNQSLNLVEKEKRLFLKQQAYQKEMLSKPPEHPESERPYHLIDEAIERLPAQQQRTWLLSRHEGLTYEEIAQKMNLSRETVKYYIRLANDSIKDYIADNNIQLFVLLLAAGYL